MKITAFERAISVLSPKAAMRRIGYRMAFEEMRGAYGYDAADNSRINRGRENINSPAAAIDGFSRDTLRARARAAERNSDIMESMISALIRNVVGSTGIRLQIQLPDGMESLESEFDKVEALWETWTKNCDVTGAQTLREMQQMIVRRYKVDGGIFILKAYTNDAGVLPFKLQVVEVDDLDSSYNESNSEDGSRTVNGIKYNKYNRPIKYYFVKYDANGLLTNQRIEVDAKDVCYLWHKKRPSQTREISGFAASLGRIYDINDLSLYMLIKEKVNACLSAFIKHTQTSGAPSMGRTGNAAGTNKTDYSSKQLTPGMIMELNEGDEISAITPPGSGGGVDFMRQQQRLAGAGVGLSYETTSRDMSQVNYSSARQGLLEDWETYGDIQQTIIDHFLRWVFNEFLYCAQAFGYINLPDFFNNRAKYEACAKWIVPAKKWIDPKKEVDAAIIAMQNKLTSYQDIVTSQGKDPYQTLKDIKQYEAWLKQLGFNNNTGGKEDA